MTIEVLQHVAGGGGAGTGEQVGAGLGDRQTGGLHQRERDAVVRMRTATVSNPAETFGATADLRA